MCGHPSIPRHSQNHPRPNEKNAKKEKKSPTVIRRMGMCHSSVSQLVPDGEESVLVLNGNVCEARKFFFFCIALSTQQDLALNRTWKVGTHFLRNTPGTAINYFLCSAGQARVRIIGARSLLLRVEPCGSIGPYIHERPNKKKG